MAITMYSLFSVHSNLDVERLVIRCFIDRMQINCSIDSMYDAQKGCMCEYLFDLELYIISHS